MIEASDAALIDSRAVASAAGSAAAPSRDSPSRSPFSMTQTSRRSGSWSRFSATVVACLAVSTTTPTACESPRIQQIWSGADVS